MQSTASPSTPEELRQRIVMALKGVGQKEGAAILADLARKNVPQLSLKAMPSLSPSKAADECRDVVRVLLEASPELAGGALTALCATLNLLVESKPYVPRRALLPGGELWPQAGR